MSKGKKVKANSILNLPTERNRGTRNSQKSAYSYFEVRKCEYELTLGRLETNRSVLQCVAENCNVLQRVPVCCSVLQSVAVFCSVLQ